MPAAAATANTVRWANFAVDVVVLGLAGLATTDEPVGPLVLLLALVATALGIWFLVLVFRTAKTPPTGVRIVGAPY